VCASSTESELHERALREGPSQRRVRLRTHSADSVAHAIFKMAASRRREVVLSAEAELMAFANVIAPGLVDRLLARVLKSRAAD